MRSFNYFSYRLLSFGTFGDKRKFFFLFEGCLSGTRLERFTIFVLGLGDLDDSAIFKFCFEHFSKDSYHVSKNVVSKTNPIISSCFF